MTDDERLSACVDAWKNQWLGGEEASPEAICREHPELLEKFKREIEAIKLLDELVGRFEDLRAGGQAPLPEDICREHPDLLDQFKKQIRKLDLFDSVFGPLEDAAPGSDEVGEVCGGRYRVTSVLDQGGQGVIYMAEDQELGRVVVVKGPGRRALGSENFWRLDHEATTIGQLEHPGIVPIYGFGHTHGGKPYYAMKYIDGVTLSAAIRRFHDSDKSNRDPGDSALAFQKLLRDFVVVCQTIAFAHNRGCIHRDIKPGNIMLGKFGEVWVVDWGLAKRLTASGTANEPLIDPEDPKIPDSDVARTRPDSVRGTPIYMSPEQAEGRSDQIGPASDVYSLGATLYELLTGKHPISGASWDEVKDNIVAGRIVPPRKANPKVAASLGAVCLKAMRPKPTDRYAGAKDLADDIERWLADEPVSAWREPWPTRAGRWLRRHRTLVAGAVAALLVGAASITVAMIGIQRERDHLAIANARLENSLYHTQFLVAHRAWQSIDLVQAKKVLENCNPRLRSFEWRYLKRQCGRRRVWPCYDSDVKRIVFSPDGRLVAAADVHGTVRLLDARTGKVLRTFRHQARPAAPAFSPDFFAFSADQAGPPAPAFSPDSQLLATAEIDGTKRKVKIWNVATGKVTRILNRLSGTPFAVAFLADEQAIVTVNYHDGGLPNQVIEVQVWEAASGEPMRSIIGPNTNQSFTPVGAISPDGRLFAWTSSVPPNPLAEFDNPVQVCETATGKALHTLRDHTQPVRMLAFTPDGERLATSSEDGTVVLWNTASGQSLLTLRGHTDAVFAVAFSPDGQQLATAGQDRGIKIWDARHGQEIQTLRGHTRTVNALAFSPQDKTLASGGGEGSVSLWEPFRSREVRVVRGLLGSVKDLAVSASTLVSTHTFGELRIERLGGTRESRQLTGSYRACALTPDGSRLAALEYGNDLWLTTPGRELHHLARVPGFAAPSFMPSRPLAFSPSGEQLARVRADPPAVLILDVRTRERLFTLSGHSGNITSVAFGMNGKQLASAGEDKSAMLWDLATGKRLRTIHTGYPVRAMAFAPDGGQLATVGYEDRGVLVWDSDTGRLRFRVQGHNVPVTCLAYSPDGRRLATGSVDRTVRLWDASTGQEVMTLRGASQEIRCVAFSPDGGWLAAGAGDDRIMGGQILIWDGRP